MYRFFSLQVDPLIFEENGMKHTFNLYLPMLIKNINIAVSTLKLAKVFANLVGGLIGHVIVLPIQDMNPT